MTDVAAAIGRTQLARLEGWTEQRRDNAEVLDAGLASIDGVVVPPVPADYRHVYHQYTIRVTADRDGVSERLRELGIGNAVYYPTPIHLLKPFLAEDGRPDARWDLPETDRAAREVLSLPIYPSLTPEELDRIADAANVAGAAS
jgi:dTDP-4-amino-4,6-dideoxygalactose transaminase